MSLASLARTGGGGASVLSLMLIDNSPTRDVNQRVVVRSHRAWSRQLMVVMSRGKVDVGVGVIRRKSTRRARKLVKSICIIPVMDIASHLIRWPCILAAIKALLTLNHCSLINHALLNHANNVKEYRMINRRFKLYYW